MGMIHHKAVLVTGIETNKKVMTRAHKRAKKLFRGRKAVSKLLGIGMNGYYSFMVAPCGSSLGWSEAVEHEEAVTEFVEYLDSLRYDDGSTSAGYVLLDYGDHGLQVEDWQGNSYNSLEKK